VPARIHGDACGTVELPRSGPLSAPLGGEGARGHGTHACAGVSRRGILGTDAPGWAAEGERAARSTTRRHLQNPTGLIGLHALAEASSRRLTAHLSTRARPAARGRLRNAAATRRCTPAGVLAR